MKPPLLGLAAALTLAVTLRAQPFEVQTTFIGAPAGVSRNGPFTVSGVIGQPESGTMAEGGTFAAGGGWPAPLIVEPSGSPTLRISLDPESGAVIVGWPATATGHQLEGNGDLGDPNGWIDVSTTPDPVGANLEVAIQPTAQPRFYRLRHRD